jgi:hypothetical protein
VIARISILPGASPRASLGVLAAFSKTARSDKAQYRRNGRQTCGCAASRSQRGGPDILETLIAIAVVVGTLRAHPPAPPADTPKLVTTEHREHKAGKPKPPHKTAPSLGF